MKLIFLASTLTAVLMSFAPEKKVSLYTPVNSAIENLTNEFDQISEERKEVLGEMATFVEGRIKAGKKAELTFICTHNSRRSHISQIWAQTAAAYYGVENVVCYSGGTEATAFNPRAVKAMENVGFKILKSTEGSNPVYEVRFSNEFAPVKAFSKKYDAAGNPASGFGAIMTCSHADQNCPIVKGASGRFSIPYDDPKEFDGTPQEEAKYAERVHQIGRDMVYAFSLIKKQ